MADVKRPILLQIGSSQEELCKPSQRKCPNSADRGSVCSEAGSSSNSSASSSLGSEIDSPSLILPYLYVGDQAQTQIDTISSLNISYILSLQSLPKFLSSSPQTTAPPTPDTEPPSSSSSSTLNRNETLKPFKQQASVLVDVLAKESKLNECPLKDTEFSEQSTQELAKYDIIDGADGGLLPSVNSSKDYLVKIKHLTDKNDTKLVDDLILKATDRDVAFDELDHAAMDAEHDVPSSSGQVTRTLLLNNSRRSELEGRILCEDLTIGQRSAGLDQESSHRTGDSLPMDDSAERDPNGVGDAETDPVASTSSSLAVPDHTISGEQGGCSLKQRCNRLSSSVHRLIRGKCINISDTFEQLLDKFFDETHSFIEEARRNKCNVLVHCKAGISRSPTIAIAYLMKWKRLHLQEAYNFVKRCRPQISPNLNFMGQLVSYERQLQRDRSQLPSPTSCCLPTLAMSSSMSQAINHPSPIESPPWPTSSREKPHSRTKDAQSERKVHNVHRRANQSNSIDTQNHDSNNKRAKLRSFFGRGRHDHHPSHHHHQ